MRKLVSLFMAILLLNVLPHTSANAQQGIANIGRLREEIARLEAVERDANTPTEVKELNSTFLKNRRTQLQAVLNKRKRALEQYLQSVETSLTVEEVQAVTTTIKDLGSELSQLGTELPHGANPPESEQAMRGGRTVYVPASSKSTSMDRESVKVSAPITASPAREGETPISGCIADLSDSDEVSIRVGKDFHYDSHITKGKINTGMATKVINGTLFNAEDPQVSLKGDTDVLLMGDDYCIVNIAEWRVTDAAKNKFELLYNHWALYHFEKNKKGKYEWMPQSDFKGTRLYGSNRVHTLFIHLGARKTWDIDYTVGVKKKTPANVQDVLDLLGVLSAKNRVEEDKNPAVSLWGGGLMCIKDVPSDIAVQGEIVVRDANAEATQQPQTYDKTYDNEGRYHWDVSIGVPLKEVKEAQFVASDNVVRTKEVTRQNAYGFLNIFPQAVDVKGDSFLRMPHLVVGVPLSDKPLDRPIVGLGYGIYKFDLKFDLFAGAVFNRVREPRTLQAGDAATQSQLESDFRTRRITKFIFGVNLPLRQVKDALSK